MKVRRTVPRRALLAGVLALAAPGAASAQAPASVDGFRSARFGTNEAEVREAIAADFKLAGPAVRSGENPVQRTSFLSVTVPGLVSGSGRAIIDYIFGYRSRLLTEVNITWAAALDPANTPKVLARTGGILQSYFAAQPFAPGKSLANRVLPNGSLLLFRGTDPRGHVVLLLLAGAVRRDAKDHKISMTPSTLALAYAADPAHPDVFSLRKGQF
jgi:hypothetical protein